MSTIRMRDIMALVVVAAILIAMIPTMVLTGLARAADNGTIDVDFQTGTSPPTVDNVTLWDNTTTIENPPMTPLVEYVIRVKVTDGATFDNLTTVKVTLYRDGDGVYNTSDRPTVSDNSQSCAIFTWTKAGSFSIDKPSGSTWELVGADCPAPNLGISTGNFDFHFKAGKVAQESTSGSAEWHIYAVADDGADQNSGYRTGEEMNWYGEISVGGPVHIGTINLGYTDKQSPAFSNTYIANGTYTRAVSASTTWTGSTVNLGLVTGTPGASQFALKADEDTNPSDATPISGTYTSVGSSHSITGDTGDPISNYLFLSLGSTGVPNGTYSGYVYYEIHS